MSAENKEREDESVIARQKEILAIVIGNDDYAARVFVPGYKMIYGVHPSEPSLEAMAQVSQLVGKAALVLARQEHADHVSYSHESLPMLLVNRMREIHKREKQSERKGQYGLQ